MDNNRRKFLKIILIGGGAFVVGKILNPLFSKFSDSPLAKSDLSIKHEASTFKVIEDKKSLSIYDASGEEIFQIDKGM